MAAPIWKDYYVTLLEDASVNSILYRICIGNDVLYQGKAFLRPGEEDIVVRINDICADYLQNVLPTLSQAEFTALTLPVTFTIKKSSDGSTWTTADSVAFLNDWSYDYDYVAATMGMAFPINGHIDSRMPLVWTGLNVSTIQATIYKSNGTTSNVYIPVAISNDFNADFNADFSKSVRSAGSGTAVFFVEAWGDLDKVVINGVTYPVVTSCARYALYYVNAYGGWDTFLIEGNTLEADSLTRHTRAVEYDNRNIQNRGRENYVNEVNKTFTFHTGWLTGDQGERMHHLLNSPDVYLYDIAREEMIPVILTNTATEYKTYKNQGNRLANYTIQAEVAQYRVRR